MGSNTSQHIKTNQEVLTSMIQESESSCNAEVIEKIDNTSIIVPPGGSVGDISISQVSSIDNINCIMSSSFDTNITSILDSLASQSISVPNFTLDFNNMNQSVNLNQLITNTVSQIQVSSCDFSARDEIDNTYIYVGGDAGDINISQDSAVSNSSCNMNNTASSTTYNEATAKAEQKAVITSLATMLFGLIVLCIILGGIIIIVFLLTGGTKKMMGGDNKDSNKSNADSIPIIPPTVMREQERLLGLNTSS